MNNLHSLASKALVSTLSAVAIAACAQVRSDSTTVPSLPRDVVGQVAKYANVAASNVAFVAAIDFQGNVLPLVPEGLKVQPADMPIRASSIESVEAVAVAAFKTNPSCMWITIGGRRYYVCQ
jgi:hypothetical protein